MNFNTLTGMKLGLYYRLKNKTFYLLVFLEWKLISKINHVYNNVDKFFT
jgi:hypothetical protein